VGTVAQFSSLTQRWASKAPLPAPRRLAAGAAVGGVVVVVARGEAADTSILGTAEYYDPSSDSWATRAPTWLWPRSKPRSSPSGENVSRSLDLLEALDATANAWLAKAAGPAPFTRATADVANSKAYVFGNGPTLAYDSANEIQ
jgi:hypothetical protein